MADTTDPMAEFRDAVNMTAHQLEEWLKTQHSQEVGQKSGPNAESTGHHSGREIITLLHKKQSEYTDEDRHQMQRVVSYIRRHLAQRPSGDITETHWRYSLMNWGHDPLHE